MKLRDAIRILEENGFYLKRTGKKHLIYTNGYECIPISRSTQTNPRLLPFLLSTIRKSNQIKKEKEDEGRQRKI